MKTAFIQKRFNRSSQVIIGHVQAIMDEYAAQGYDMTLRQVYYQLVARGHIENTIQSYKRIGSIVNDARLAGLLDWEQMVDRTRPIRALSHWDSPSDIVRTCAQQFRLDTREGQEYVEVWVEKEALAGVVQPVCQDLDVPCLVDRGFVSQSAMYQAACRLRGADSGVILYLGDHDPSGIDMTRDVNERLADTFGCDLHVERLALNMDQVEQYSPPPNPAKETDSRFSGYVDRFGDECWELDALEPQVIAALIRDAVARHTDEDLRQEIVDRQERGRARLALVAKQLAKEER